MNPSSYLKVLQNTKYSVHFSKALAQVDLEEERSGSGPRPYFTPNWNPQNQELSSFSDRVKDGTVESGSNITLKNWKVKHLHYLHSAIL